jgi:hypothetical protein
MSIRIGDWVRIDDYRVGQVVGTGYGGEVTILTSYGQVVQASTNDVVLIPNPISEPRVYHA